MNAGNEAETGAGGAVEHAGGLLKSTRSSFVVMACTLISRLLGFARIAVITGIFGATGRADIINLTFSIPNNLRKLLAEGALSSAFIPELSRALYTDPEGGTARRIVRKLFSFQVLILVPVCLLSILFARPLITHVLSEFSDPEMIAQSSRLFRWFINYLLLISLSAVLMGIINAHQRFIVPAVTPILFSVTVIASIFLTHQSLGIFSVALGVLAGGVFQVLFQLPLFRRLGYDAGPDLRFADPAFRRILRTWLPVLATSSLFTITYQIAIRFASGLGEGSVTSLAIAINFFQLPFGIFSASVTTVLFPRMSRQVAENDTSGLRESLQYGIRFLLVLLVPATLFMCVAARELISVGFQRGAFPIARTEATADVLIAYTVGLFGVGTFTFVQRLFYSLGRHRIPFYTGLVVSVVDVGLSLWLKETPLATSGIALANSISFTLGVGILLYIARKILGPLGGRSIALTGIKTAGAVVIGSLLLWLYLRITGEWWRDGSSLATFGLLFGGFVLFTGSVTALYRLTRVEMLWMLLRRSPKIK